MRMAVARQANRDGSTVRARPAPAAPKAARGPAASLLALQRAIGNRATGKSIQAYRDASGGRAAAAEPRGHHDGPAAQREQPGGTGRPLDPAVRSLMESRFGADFRAVRVHTDAQAARMAERLGALAYTVGRHVFFATGQYRPATARGKRLVAHELMHVLQQSGTAKSSRPRLSPGHHPAEREADRAADAVSSGAAPAPPRIHLPPSIQRQEGALLAFLADLEQRRRRVQSLARTGTPSISPIDDPATGKLRGYRLTQEFALKLASDARVEAYAIVQWIKGELYEQRGSNKVYWPADIGKGLFGRSGKNPWRFTDWIVDTPDADPRFGSHYGLTVTVPTTDIEDSPGIVVTGGPLPAGLRWVVSARMGVYPWGYRIPTTIGDWEKMRPEPFREVNWGWDVTVDPDQTSLSVNVT